MLGIHITTLSRWLRTYREEGLKKVMELNYGNRQSDMEAHRQTLLEHFEKNPPSTIAEAVAKIEELIDIRRSETQVSKFLKSMGFKLRKTGGDPWETKVIGEQIFSPYYARFRGVASALFSVVKGPNLGNRDSFYPIDPTASIGCCRGDRRD